MMATPSQHYSQVPGVSVSIVCMFDPQVPGLCQLLLMLCHLGVIAELRHCLGLQVYCLQKRMSTSKNRSQHVRRSLTWKTSFHSLMVMFLTPG